MRALLFSASALVLLPAAAFAQEPFTWSGAYIGAHGGYAWGEGEGSYATDIDALTDVLTGGIVEGTGPPPDFVPLFPELGEPASSELVGSILEILINAEEPAFDYEGDLDGAIAGGQLGFNWQSGGLVFGIEADASWSDIGATISDTPLTNIVGDPDLAADAEDGDIEGDFAEGDFFGEASLSVDYETDINWLATVRGRVGAAWDRVLIYATGGAAFADTEVLAQLSVTVAGQTVNDTDVLEPFARTIGSESTGDDVLVGYTVGGGIEVAFSENWSAKVEYNYVDLGEIEVDFAGETEGETITSEIDIDLHIVKGGINYRF